MALVQSKVTIENSPIFAIPSGIEAETLEVDFMMDETDLVVDPQSLTVNGVMLPLRNSEDFIALALLAVRVQNEIEHAILNAMNAPRH